MSMRLELIASTDEPTGWQTWGAFLVNSKRLWSDTRRRNIQAAALIIDVDNFQLVNDQFGQSTGDYALQHTATALRNRL